MYVLAKKEKKGRSKPVVGLDVLDGLTVVLEHVDADHRAVEGRVGALDHLVVQVLAASKVSVTEEEEGETSQKAV